jgi:hypothetical protein
MSDAEIEAVTVGEAERHPELQVVDDYNPDWPRLFEREAARIRAALGPAPAHGPIISEIVAKRSRSLFIGCFANHQDT